MTRVSRWVRAFGRFWVDFLVGDTPELFVGTVVTMVVVAIVAKLLHAKGVAEVVLPLSACAMVIASVVRERRRRS